MLASDSASPRSIEGIDMMTDEELQEIVDYSLEPRPEQVRCIAIELLSYRHGIGPARAYVAELLDKISNLRKAHDVLDWI